MTPNQPMTKHEHDALQRLYGTEFDFITPPQNAYKTKSAGGARESLTAHSSDRIKQIKQLYIALLTPKQIQQEFALSGVKVGLSLIYRVTTPVIENRHRCIVAADRLTEYETIQAINMRGQFPSNRYTKPLVHQSIEQQRDLYNRFC